jgi:adenylate cyclase
LENQRQLAAILFADIAGYTSLMQKDEKTASVLLHRFQNEMEEKVADKNGQIVNFYGDGALCIFRNTLEAMHCAMVLQNDFRNSPNVPVRIGIHSGTVVFENEKVYGDSVNLTSRIESMGIPGAVLASKEVRDDLKNQPDLEMVSLGSFEFKNVEEPLEVFALSNSGFKVPKREEMQGKLKEGSLNKSIAVLPFANMSGNPEEEYFSDGITEEIIHALAQLKELKVVGRTSSFSFKGKDTDLREVGQKLNVGTVLEGSFRKAGNRIRITAQLIKVSDGFHLWSERYDRELNDVFEVQDEIAATIAEKLKVTLFEKPIEAGKPQTQNIEAYQLYLKGRYFKGKRVEGYAKALECFNRTIELDPDYSAAYSGLAVVYYYMSAYGMLPPKEGYLKARELAYKAIEINPKNAEGYLMLGGVAFCFDWDWENTLTNFDKAMSIDKSELELYKGSAATQLIIGDIEKAIRFSKKAIELEPINPDAWIELPYCYLYNKQFDEALKVTNEILELDPNDIEAIRLKGIVYEKMGDLKQAISHYEKATELSGGEGFAPFYLAIALTKIGQPDLARNLLNGMLEQSKTVYVPALFIAYIYAALKEMDTAFEWLEKAFEDKDGMLVFINVEPAFEVFQDDPRFEEYIKRINFPK